MITLGQTQSFSKTITEADIVAYAGLTGDYNPVHVNDVAAKDSVFGARVAHGMLSAGFISTVLGTKLPGEGTIYLVQTLKFLSPVRIGDTITAICTVKEILNEQKGIYRLETKCENQNGDVVVDGDAVVKYRDEARGITHNHDVDVIKPVETNKSSFYSPEEVAGIGLASYGSNVLISRNTVLYNPELLYIGNNVRIDDFTTISGKVKIGNYVHIAQFCGLYGGTEGIYMGDFSGLSSRVVIYATSNDYSGESMTNPTVPEKYKTTDKNDAVHLGKHVIVGTTSVILPGVDIGIGCSIGSMTMVSRDCEPWGIYVGSPARKVKERSRKLLEFEAELRAEEQDGGVFCPNNGRFRWCSFYANRTRKEVCVA